MIKYSVASAMEEAESAGVRDDPANAAAAPHHWWTMPQLVMNGMEVLASPGS